MKLLLLWPIVSLIIFLVVIWATGTVSAKPRRTLRVLSFLILFTPGVAGSDSAAIVFPLVLVPLAAVFNWLTAPRLVVISALLIMVGFSLILFRLLITRATSKKA